MDDNESLEGGLDLASKATRFNVHLMDVLVFIPLFLTYVFSMETLYGVLPEGDVMRPLGGLALYLLYFTGFEFAFSKTPGKFITRTKVVNKDGSKPEFLMLLFRNACRLIPFDDLSYLFDQRGWHDRISRTYVIKE